MVLRWTLGLLLAAWSVLLAAWLILQWGILPRIETWRPQLEARASQALGLTVRVGRLSVQSGGWMPTIDKLGRFVAAQVPSSSTTTERTTP